MDTLHFESPSVEGLVSVVIPTRNGDAYIGAALDSIAAQQYDRWEVLVIEDGSHGETESIVRGFADAHPGHRVHFQRNPESRGAAYTRNRCFELAAGQFVAFLDCDDRWLPSHLHACVSALNDSGDDVAYSAAAMFEDGTDHMLGFWGPNHDEVNRFPHSLLGRSFVTPSATVVRRSVIEDVGAWRTDFRFCEDADFMLRAAKLAKRFRCVGGVHCLYRKSHQGATTQKIAGTIEEYATLSSWHLDMPGGSDRQARRAVAASYAVSAMMHAKNHTQADPSATRSRAAPLYLQAWRLRPGRIGYLLKAARYAATKGWSGNDNLPAPPRGVAPAASSVPSARAAA